MRNFIAFAALLAVSPGSAAQDAFQDARDLARLIIGAELEGQFCKPEPIPELQRRAMTRALARIDRGGLSDPTGLSPLNLAVISDDIPTLRRLSALGYPLDSSDSTLLHDAAFHDSKRVLSFLLANGADPNSANSYGATALVSAAANGRVDAARILLAAGATPNSRTKDEGTALHYAIGCRHQEMVNTLLVAGAEIDPKAHALAEVHGVELFQQQH